MAVFTLEAIQAGWGDALLLHWGEPTDLHSILIDGGPGGEYTTTLVRRLGELRQDHQPNQPYVFTRAVVTHIDADHIAGVLDVLRLQDGGDDDLFKFGGLWHNSFASVIDEPDREVVQLALSALAELDPDEFERLATPAQHADISSFWTTDEVGGVVIASVGQGIDLRGQAERLGIPINEGDDLLEAPHAPLSFDGLQVTIVSPNAALLDNLREHWNDELSATNDAREAMIRLAAEYDDKSPPNLASIVLLAEFDGRKVLLTGDARGDLVLRGLEDAGILGDNPLELDILKLPHHGSVRDYGADFFQRLRARHYVVSANGRYGNPESQTLQWLIESRPDDDFTIWLTNRTSPVDVGYEQRLTALFNSYWSSGRGFQVTYRDDEALSLRVELDETFPL